MFEGYEQMLLILENHFTLLHILFKTAYQQFPPATCCFRYVILSFYFSFKQQESVRHYRMTTTGHYCYGYNPKTYWLKQ